MANVYQQQSLRRKLIYFGLIVALFAATLVVRKSAFGVESQAQQLQLREEDVGQVELTGSAFRLTLTGSRGLVVCYLWLMAD